MFRMRFGYRAMNCGAQDLHITGEHDEVNAVSVQQLKFPLLLFEPILGCFRKHEHGNAELRGHRPQVVAVREHQWNLDGPFARLPPREDVVQTVGFTCDRDRHALTGARVPDVPGHRKPSGHRRKRRSESGRTERES